MSPTHHLMVQLLLYQTVMLELCLGADANSAEPQQI